MWNYYKTFWGERKKFVTGCARKLSLVQLETIKNDVDAEKNARCKFVSKEITKLKQMNK